MYADFAEQAWQKIVEQFLSVWNFCLQRMVAGAPMLEIQWEYSLEDEFPRRKEALRRT